MRTDEKFDKRRKIVSNFSKSTSYYHNNAIHQQEVARRLSKALEPWKDIIPSGPILEIGAGTGFLTRYLLEMYPHREAVITDLSQEMLDFCKDEMNIKNDVEYKVLDAESEKLPKEKFALIAGNYVAQWFKYPAKSLSKMAASLKPGALMLISFPAKESFANWRQYCLDLGIPFTGNALPDLEQVVIELSMGPLKVDYYEDDMIQSFDNLFDFFKNLKHTGTSTSLTGKNLTVKQFKLLDNYWKKQENGKINVQYHTAFIAAKRDFES